MTSISNLCKNLFLSAILIVTTVFSSGLLITPVLAAGSATMYFSPSGGTYSVGSNVAVNINLSTIEAANAVSGTISFDRNLMEVVSLNKSGSKISFWVKEPSFSNGNGTISFEGIIPNPGYTGKAAKIIGVNFKLKAAGEATARFSGGQVLANDGNGTNITGSLGSARFTIGTADKPTSPTQTAFPSAPQIVSSTHPDSNAWYSNNSPQFNWSVPGGITAVSTLVSTESNTDPGNSNRVQTGLSLKDQKDGIYYLHVKFKNKQGFGPITHFKFQIDKELPTDIDLQKQDDGYIITAIDKYSGIDHYEWREGSGEYIRLVEEGGYYSFGDLSPGDHKIQIKAVDRAGNTWEKTLSVTVTATNYAPVTAFNYMSLWPYLLALLVLLLVLLVYMLYRRGAYAYWLMLLAGKKKREKPQNPNRNEQNKAYLDIADDLMEQIKLLEHVKAKRELTHEESKLLKSIHNTLNKVEELIKPSS